MICARFPTVRVGKPLQQDSSLEEPQGSIPETSSQIFEPLYLNWLITSKM